MQPNRWGTHLLLLLSVLLPLVPLLLLPLLARLILRARACRKRGTEFDAMLTGKVLHASMSRWSPGMRHPREAFGGWRKGGGGVFPNIGYKTQISVQKSLFCSSSGADLLRWDYSEEAMG